MVSPWQGTRVLVTGGASFIGSHLVDMLLTEGAGVCVVDDLSSGSLDNLRTSLPHVEFMRGDLRSPDVALRACSGREVVFHLAAVHGGRGYIDTHPAECAANMIMDGNVFAAALHKGVERICYASSACVYPTTLQEFRDPEVDFLLEEDMANTCEPGKAFADGVYGWSKLMGELVLQSYCEQHGIRGVPCRIFTAYGERENETHAVIAWIARAFVRQDPFVVWGDGQQDRNFTYVGDIVRGLLAAAERVSNGTPVNLGRSDHVKVIDAVNMVLQICGHQPAIVFDRTRPVGVFSRAASPRRAKRLLGWEPATSVHEGLHRTIDWYYRTHDRTRVAANLERLLEERAAA